MSPTSLIIGNSLCAVFMTFPEFQWARFKQLFIREGSEWEGKEKQSRATGQGPVSPSVETHSISELFCRY